MVYEVPSISSSILITDATHHKAIFDDVKVCVCLNNYGIAFMERGFYNEAVDIFQATIDGLTTVCNFLLSEKVPTTTTKNNNNNERVHETNYNIRNKLREALLQMRSVQSSSSSLHHSYQKAIQVKAQSICCCEEYYDNRESSSLEDDIIISPIRIDSNYDTTNTNNAHYCFETIMKNPRLLSAIVLYNFGLSYIGLSKKTTLLSSPSTTSKSVQSIITRLLKSSYSILEIHLHQPCYDDTIAICNKWLVYMSLSVLQTLQQQNKKNFHCCLDDGSLQLEHRFKSIYTFIKLFDYYCPSPAA